MNGEIIEQGEFTTHYWVAEKKLLRQVWTNEKALMSEQDFKDTMLKYVALYDSYDIELVLVDSLQINFAVGDEGQDWLNQNVMSVVAQKAKKLAFVVPEDILSQMSIELTLEDYENKPTPEGFMPKYFDKEEEAHNWLLEG